MQALHGPPICCLRSIVVLLLDTVSIHLQYSIIFEIRTMHCMNFPTSLFGLQPHRVVRLKALLVSGCQYCCGEICCVWASSVINKLTHQCNLEGTKHGNMANKFHKEFVDLIETKLFLKKNSPDGCRASKDMADIGYKRATS